MPQISILVVDDDHDVREYLRELLTSEGYGVTVLDDSTGVVEELERGDHHVVVLDLSMPKLSGIDLLGRIPGLETAASSIEHDVSAYIRTPFAANDFREAIRRIVKRKGLLLGGQDMEPSRRN